MSRYVIGIDVGTGSTKGVLVSLEGEIAATVVLRHDVDRPRPELAEFDAEGVAWPEIVRICRELSAGRDPGEIGAVCVSAMGPSLVVTDEDARPLRPAILYGVDARAVAEIDELTARLGEERILAVCGKTLSTQAVGPKLLWVRRNEPELAARMRRWYSLSSWLVARMTGEYVLDHHTASQCDPLYDVNRADWHEAWAAEVTGGLPLPRLAWPGEVVGALTSAAAAELGLAPGTPVCAGTVDAWSEAWSAGVRRPGDLMLMYGSTMFFVQLASEPSPHPALWATSGIEPGRPTLAAGMSTSGTLVEWIRELTGELDIAELIAEAEGTPPGADGLLLLPYFAGERTPIQDPRARGTITGLTLAHTRGHLLRAAYEGIAFGIRQIIELLEEADAPAQRVIAVGGGTNAELWLQIVSDVTGRQQLVPELTIGASYGDALLAAVGAGLVPPGTDWARVGRVVTPRPEFAELYRERYALYRELYPRLREQMHALASARG